MDTNLSCSWGERQKHSRYRIVPSNYENPDCDVFITAFHEVNVVSVSSTFITARRTVYKRSIRYGHSVCRLSVCLITFVNCVETVEHGPVKL